MSLTFLGIIGIAVLVFFIISRVPIGFAMILVGFVGFCYVVSISGGLSLIAMDIFNTFSSYNLSVIPLFILMGQIAFRVGMGERLYYAAYKWLGHMPGGLAITTIGGCAGFAAICGSSPATAGTMCGVALPEMRKYGYDMTLALSLIHI